MTSKLLSLTTVLVVVVTSWASATGTAAAGPADGCANHAVRTFKVEGRALKDRYRVGETAKVAVTVVRSAEPIVPEASGAGEHYHRSVEGARVGVMLTINGTFFAGASVTDENGAAIVEIDIDEPVRTGWAVAGGRAWRDVVSSPCPVTEEGILWARKLFRVVGSK